jgi:cytochrome P450
MASSTKQAGGDLSAVARLDDVAFYLGDPYPTFARLRREAPVFWCESGKFWALSKHEDVVWAELQGNPPLTSEQGMHIREAANPTRADDRDIGNAQRSGAAFMSDPPGHTRFRRVVSSAFTPDRITSLEPRINAIAAELLDRLPVGEPVDFVDAVSVPISIQVIAEFLGVPRDRWDDLRRWTDVFIKNLGGSIAEGSPEASAALQSNMEMFEYFGQTLAERRAEPADDLMSAAASLELDGELIPEASQVMICVSVLTAGNETTRNTISGGMVAFAEHPEQWDTLVAEPKYVDNAAEELLRWVNPVIHFGRRATEPLTIRDQTIAEGEFLVMLYPSANRDEDVWPNADLFDVTRPNERKHLSFGWGLHRCIGAGLAQAELRAVLNGLRDRFRRWELAGPIERGPSTMVNEYGRVPVTLTGI